MAALSGEQMSIPQLKQMIDAHERAFETFSNRVWLCQFSSGKLAFGTELNDDDLDRVSRYLDLVQCCKYE